MFVMVPNNKRQMKYNTITHLNIQNVCGVLTFSHCVCVHAIFTTWRKELLENIIYNLVYQ